MYNQADMWTACALITQQVFPQQLKLGREDTWFGSQLLTTYLTRTDAMSGAVMVDFYVYTNVYQLQAQVYTEGGLSVVE